MKLKLLITQHPKEGANLTNSMKMIKSPFLEMIFSYQEVKREDIKQENFLIILVLILTTTLIINTDKEKNHPHLLHVLNITRINQKKIFTIQNKTVTLYNTLSNSWTMEIFNWWLMTPNSTVFAATVYPIKTH